MLGLGGMCICAVIMTVALALLVSKPRSKKKRKINKIQIGIPDFGILSMISSLHKHLNPLFFCSIGQCSMDELHQHAFYLWFCGLLWGWPRSHPLVLCSWAVLSRSKASCHGCCRLFQLDCQLYYWHVLPVCRCEYPQWMLCMSTNGFPFFTHFSFVILFWLDNLLSS